MEIDCTFTCVYCFQLNETIVDISGGTRQKYVEDCQICCRPNLLFIVIDEELRNAEITAEAT
jgi:ABC-type glutathione transport system ATPase component